MANRFYGFLRRHSEGLHRAGNVAVVLWILTAIIGINLLISLWLFVRQSSESMQRAAQVQQILEGQTSLNRSKINANGDTIESLLRRLDALEKAVATPAPVLTPRASAPATTRPPTTAPPSQSATSATPPQPVPPVVVPPPNPPPRHCTVTVLGLCV